MPTPQLVRIVHQTRYDDGELYWDLSGRVRRALRSQDEGWEFVERPDVNFWRGKLALDKLGDAYQGRRLGLSFGCLACDFALDLPPGTRFGALDLTSLGETIVRVTTTILAGLAVQRVTRVGLRAVLLYEYSSEASARDAMSRMLCAASLPQDPSGSLGAAAGGAIVRATRLNALDIRTELSTATIEFREPATKKQGVILDIDIAEKPVDPAHPALSKHMTEALPCLALAHSAFGSNLE